MYLRKTYNNRALWCVFLSCMLLVVGVFGKRVLAGNVQTALSDGQILKISDQYTMGSILDRNQNLIVQGQEGGANWNGEETEEIWGDLLGISIRENVNSPFTIAGNCPWIFGTEDNRFGLSDLFCPWKERVGGSVQLTLDMNLQQTIHDMLENYGYENSTVMVSNYKTGEILAAYGDIFQKRYHPGSTIKPVLAAAILNLYPELEDFTYQCTRPNHNFHTEQGLYRINCAYGAYHGLMNMESAIAQSCNGYFISLLQQVPKEELQEELKKWGFDTVIAYEQFSYWDQSFIKESDLETDYLLAAIGQANAYSTVAGMHFCTNALMNQGTLKEPVLMNRKCSEPGDAWQDMVEEKTYPFCQAEAADAVKGMMEQVTINGIGKSFYYPGFAAKTGTSQKADENGTLVDQYTIWTTGGLVQEETPYAITVCLDQIPETVDSTFAGKIAREILVYIVEEGLDG